MSFLQSTDARRHWLLILLLLVLIYLVYLLLNQLHPPPPIPIDPCTTDCPNCDTLENFLRQDGPCHPTTQTVKFGCLPTPDDPCFPPGIICFDRHPLNISPSCTFTSPFPSGTVTYFNDFVYYEITGEVSSYPSSCHRDISVCYNYVNSPLCNSGRCKEKAA